MLVAEGFLEARLLARKFITPHTLCKELLSKQACDCPGAHGAGAGGMTQMQAAWAASQMAWRSPQPRSRHVRRHAHACPPTRRIITMTGAREPSSLC